MANNYKEIIFIEDDAIVNSTRYAAISNLDNVSLVSKQFEIDDFFYNPNLEILGRYPSEGNCFVRHPFRPNCYVSLVNAEEIITSDKWEKFCFVIQHLGAKSFKGKREETEIEQVKYEIDAKGFVTSIDFNVNIKKEESTTGRKNSSLEKHFEPNPNENLEDNYKVAKEILEANNLFLDPHIKALVEQRNPQITNKLTKVSYEMDLASEFNSSLSIAAGIGKAGIFSVNAEYAKKISVSKQIKTKIEISF